MRRRALSLARRREGAALPDFRLISFRRPFDPSNSAVSADDGTPRLACESACGQKNLHACRALLEISSA